MSLGDHQYASDAVARKPAARHGPAQGPSRLDVLGQGGQTTRFHHDGDVPRLASSKLPPARRQTRFSHSNAPGRGGKVALGQRRPSRAVRGPADVQTFAWYRHLQRSCNSCRLKRVGRKRVRGPPRIFASGFDNFSCFRSAPMHVTLGPRQGASDQPRFRPAASASRLFSGHILRTSESGTVLSAVSYEGQVTAHVEPVARPRPRRCKTGRARRDFVSARRERAARKTCD